MSDRIINNVDEILKIKGKNSSGDVSKYEGGLIGWFIGCMVWVRRRLGLLKVRINLNAWQIL